MEALWGKTIPDAIYHQIVWGKAVFLGLINSLFHFSVSLLWVEMTCVHPLLRNGLIHSTVHKHEQS